MLFGHVKAAHARFSFDNLVWVGADKMNRRKGHNFPLVVADLIAKQVILATPRKDASVWQEFAQELLRDNGHSKAIQDVAIDRMRAVNPMVSTPV